MMLRYWSARAVDAANADAYERHATGAVFPALERMAGFRGAMLLRREVDDAIELVVMTLWDSMAAIHAFAGADAEAAVVGPDAQAVLTSFDSRVRHYQLTADTRLPTLGDPAGA